MAMYELALVIQKVTQGRPISWAARRMGSTSETRRQRRQLAAGSSDSTSSLKCGTMVGRERSSAATSRDVPRRVLVGRGQAVGDGGEAEPRRPRQRARAARAEEAPPVVLGVDEGDVEAVAVVEEPCELQRRGDVALRGEREEHQVRLRRRRRRHARHARSGVVLRARPPALEQCNALTRFSRSTKAIGSRQWRTI